MDNQLQQLEAVLRGQVEAQQRLLSVLGRKLEAIRRADHKQVTGCCQEENQQVQAIGEMEKRRLVLVAELTRAVDPAAGAPLRLVELCERLAEPWRGKLLLLRKQLRELLERVRAQAALARGATEALSRHMQGLVQSIGAVFTGVGVYGRDAQPPRSATAMSTFSTTA